MRVFGSILGASLTAALSSPATLAETPAVEGSTAFQMNASHNGAMTFTQPFKTPLKVKWSIDLGGPISYPVVSGNIAVVIAKPKIGTVLTAIDYTKGKVVWQKLITSSSYLAEDNGMVFLSPFEGPLEAFSVATGKSVWSLQLPYEMFFD